MKRVFTLKSKEKIQNIKTGGQILNEILLKLMQEAKPGISLLELEEIADNMIKKNNVKGAFKGYSGYPANLCLSVDDCVVHGIPDKYVLRPGDLLKIDLGITYKGGISDSAVSIVIGGNQTNQLATDLIDATKSGIDKSIKAIGPGAFMYDYSSLIYNHMKNEGFEVIKCLTGHGVGDYVHELPYVYNRPYKDTKSEKFQEGMVIAIEPITSVVSTDVYAHKNGWNIYTNKGDYGAQREYTLVVTSNGYDILSGIV